MDACIVALCLHSNWAGACRGSRLCTNRHRPSAWPVLLHQQVRVVGVHAVDRFEQRHLLEARPVGLDVGLVKEFDVEGTPVMRMCNAVRLQSKPLSPAAEAFRYAIIERGEAHHAGA